MLVGLIFLLFIFGSVLIPGYVAIKKIGRLSLHPGIELSLGIALSIVFFSLLAAANYVLKVDATVTRVIGWLVLLLSGAEFFRSRLYRPLWKQRFPLICWLAMALFAASFFSLPYKAAYTKFPDPTFVATNHYNTLNVKVLNIAQTQANDNYIPYRQAQFFTNRLNPIKTPFIAEWDVGFFERTPLMGAYTASVYDLFNEKTPQNLLWVGSTSDPDHTYLQFQLIACVLNMMFVVPSFYVLIKLFNLRTAIISCLFLIISSFFLYNTVFSWPKSLIAFFIMLSWLFILENKLAFTVLAGAISGIAYLTHDLAILYIGATFIYLLFTKRYKESAYYLIIPLIFALPWLYAANIYYKQPSTFIDYPISTQGIPPVGQGHQLWQTFLHTPISKLIIIRLQSFGYLFTPIHWDNSIFSIPGALGYGLIIPFFLGLAKQRKNIGFLILLLFPVIFEVLFVGWTDGLGALHFAEAVVVLGYGLGVNWVIGLQQRFWAMILFLVNLIELWFFMANSYSYKLGGWVSSPGPLLRVALMVTVSIGSAIVLLRFIQRKKIWISD